MLISSAVKVGRALVGVGGTVAAMQAVAPDADALWRWAPPAVILAVAWWLVRNLGGAVGRDQGRAFLKTDDAHTAMDDRFEMLFESDESKRKVGDVMLEMLNNQRFQILLRDTVSQLFRDDIVRRNDYYKRTDVLENRIGGMAQSLSNIEAFAEGQQQMQVALNAITNTMTAIAKDIHGHGEQLRKLDKHYEGLERRTKPRADGSR